MSFLDIETEDGICPYCSGTGEGTSEYEKVCRVCGGTGEHTEDD